ncbi:sigma-54 interaction domain-containing protein [Alkalimonas amylolytica]|uniref:Sigma-54 specific transcriptional regulator, flagellar regulatory protein A n=1 Tax=Alkalimonas amylolytica TaxID=152573 RepID=A0A1H4B7K2_ALKAM|nr:sigma-54 dependent transcriptional regulator [Alkalimonas amylolytica]SEA43928.1 sigma-54 specific transcriptional regulator, flagellar regulatory protein A [Alkalimonas amylolytica]
MRSTPKLYLVDSNLSRQQRLSTILDFVQEPYQIIASAELKSCLQQSEPAVVLLGEVADESQTLIEQFPATAFLLLDSGGERLLQFGNVVALLTEPFRYDSLMQSLRDCQEYHRLLPGQQRKDQTARLVDMVGSAEPMQQVRFLIQQVAPTEANVMILGDSGTGKEVVARNIHLLSRRADGPFVPINCGAIPGELLESELFGHEKGAFTGAFSTRKGRFELAQGGTLFLDEIGDMPLPMQVKLLRVLQERIYERVGGNQPIKADVRIIAATHRNLEQMIADGRFREDLFYRLNVFPIETPALSERTEDLPQLCQELIQRQHQAGHARVKFTERAMESLKLHAWPGNVRELANLVERMAIMYPNQVVDVADLPLRYQHLEVDSYVPDYPESLQERDLLNELFQADDDEAAFSELSDDSFQADPQLPHAGLDLKEHLAELEIQFITQALERHDFVVARAADMLGLRRTTLVEKMRKYNLAKDD